MQKIITQRFFLSTIIADLAIKNQNRQKWYNTSPQMCQYFKVKQSHTFFKMGIDKIDTKRVQRFVKKRELKDQREINVSQPQKCFKMCIDSKNVKTCSKMCIKIFSIQNVLNVRKRLRCSFRRTLKKTAVFLLICVSVNTLTQKKKVS